MDRSRYTMLHTNIPVSDIARSQEFYERVLGCRYMQNLGPNKVVLDLNGFHFFIEQSADFKVNREFHIGLYTDEQGVYDYAAFLDEQRIPLVQGNNPAAIVFKMSEERTALYFEDPDGWTIEVYSGI